jgi:hypothetical protein
MSKVLSFPTPAKRAKQDSNPGSGDALVSLEPDEQLVLDGYFDRSLCETDAFEEACERLEVPMDTNCPRVEAAVGQVLLQNIQERLPQWAVFYDDEATFGRTYRKRRKSKKLEFLPQHLFTINWADSAPGFSWPEAYNLAYIPRRHRYVVLVSRDSTDVWGCIDQAIGHFDADEDRLLGVRKIIGSSWRPMDGSKPMPWSEVLRTGLIDRATAERWRREVWCEPEYRHYLQPQGRGGSR